jgi:hypothetical protein
LAAQLNEKGRHKDDVDKLHKLLGGLSDNWAGERTSLEVCANFTPYSEMCAILQGIAVKRGELTGEVIIGGEAHVTGQERRKFPATKQCFGCGKFNAHDTSQCDKVKMVRNANGRYNNVCWKCYKTGHISRTCPLKSGKQERANVEEEEA